MTPPKDSLLAKNELDGIIACLIECGIADDSNFSVLKQYEEKWEITFKGAEHVTIALSDINYSDIHRELSERRSYNLRLIDGGLLQLMYRFKDGLIEQHRLAYYPSPRLRPFPEDPEAYMRDELFLEIVSRRIVAFPLRFDFDDQKGVHVDILHPKTHLTLGDVKTCRIPVTAPLTPHWFVEFILRNFYYAKMYDLVRRLPKRILKFRETITKNERCLIHVAIPKY